MLSLEQFLLAAEAVLGIDADRLKQATKIGSAESARGKGVPLDEVIEELGFTHQELQRCG